MLIVTGTLFMPPDELPRFVDDFAALAAITRQREGCLSYDTVVLDPAKGVLLAAERWRDEGALTAHLRADATMAFVARWAGHLRGDVRVYDAINERGLGDVTGSPAAHDPPG